MNTRRAMKAGAAFVPPDRKTQGGILDLSARENLTLADLRPFTAESDADETSGAIRGS